MALHRHLAYVFVCATVFAVSAQAQTVGQTLAANQTVEIETAPEASTSWLDQLWTFPLLRFFVPPPPLEFALDTAPEVPPCLLEPLPEMDDLEALAFEASVGSPAVVNTGGLTRRTALALDRFERLVTSAGGSFILTSAYRPAAYQDHLQAVWDKWMLELHDNFDEGCAHMKAAVQDEFARHQLLETQRPVSFSDHTRGISFDAAIQMPRRGRRRLSVDLLARRVGFHRPARAKDPVHFRLIAGV